ncbi:MAG: LysR family transcriptional regulator [Parvularcula sp.]|nr:LysR family transcriptional regulator [Parvularcula sp.]
MDEQKLSEVRWEDLSAFLAVARTGGLSAAARSTGSSAPTLGRRMRALERTVGRELFVRRSHGYDLTDAGRTMLAELESIAGRIERITARPAGDAPPLVKLSAGTWTTLVLVRRLRDLVNDPQDVRIRFLAAEDILNIGRREAVIGIRNRQPAEKGLAGRKLARVHFAPYSAPGAPDGWIKVHADTPSARWVASNSGDSIAHEVSHPRLALDMALAGVGRVILPTFIGDAEAGLERAGDPIPDLSHDQWLVTHDDDRSLPEVRRTIDRVVGILGRGLK